MGCGMSAEERAAASRSHEIDQMLRREGEKAAREVKLLLLGEAAHSRSSTPGPSTIMFHVAMYSANDEYC